MNGYDYQRYNNIIYLYRNSCGELVEELLGSHNV